MTTRIFLVRHGATTLSAEDRFAGESDVPLSEAGRHQAALLGERLAAVPLAAVYASPLGRTMDTARIVAAPHRLDVVPLAAMREISHGRWEGQTRDYVERQYPDEYARWESDPWTFAPEGGETGLALCARALPALLELVTRHHDSSILIASHKATIRLLLSALLGFDARTYRDRLDQSPAALNVVDFRDTVHARLALFNDTSHYEPGGIPHLPERHLSKWWG